MIDYLGWTATAVFVTSYFCSKPDALKRVQMLGALIWIAYGILIGASPVVVANVLVFAVAAWTILRPLRARNLTAAGTATPRAWRRSDPARRQ